MSFARVAVVGVGVGPPAIQEIGTVVGHGPGEEVERDQGDGEFNNIFLILFFSKKFNFCMIVGMWVIVGF